MKPFATVHEPTRLRPGDVIDWRGQACKVVRVSPSAAVVEVKQPARTFTSRTGRTVKLKPRAALERISANSDVPILHRKPTKP